MTWPLLMSGEIEVDHTIPIASFNLENAHEQKLAFVFHNCKPMWADKNRAKSDRMEIDGKIVLGRHLRKSNVIPFREVA